MDVEKWSSKGGFLHLFDWNVKSRKKLFSNKSELPEDSKQGKENATNSMVVRPQLVEVDEDGPCARDKRNGDYNCPSSITNDEGYGARAPGVVARLMGLDSLPTSSVAEPSCTPFCNSFLVKDCCSQRSNFNFRIEHHNMNNTPKDGISRNLVESRLQKTHNRPIERFQTEILPPKSAKSIPITHHRMLSPIKSPGFIPTNNAAYIMEAAAKIIEQGPSSTTKVKLPCMGSSSVPLRIRDLKEKIEAAKKPSGPEVFQKPKEPISKCSTRQHSEKNQGGLGDAQLYNATSLRNKGTSVSLAVQAKVNIQRREGSSSSGNRSSTNRKEGGEIKPGQLYKSQTSTHKTVQKRNYTSRTSDVLKQNKQKQNCVANKDTVLSKSAVSNQLERKASSTSAYVRPLNKASNKLSNSVTGSRKINTVAKDTGKGVLSSRTRSSGKKQPGDKDIQFEGSVDKNSSICKDRRTVKCNVATEECLNWEAVDRKKSMDVVSFTFTSPIKRSPTGSQSSGQVTEKSDLLSVDSCDKNSLHELKNPTSSSVGVNVTGGDALSALLEQKLKELTCRIESSNSNLMEAGNSACIALGMQEPMNPLNSVNSISMEHCNSLQLNLCKDKSNNPYETDGTLVDGLLLKAKQKWQVLEEMEGHTSSRNYIEYGKEFDCQYTSPSSNPELSSTEGSHDSSISKTSSITNGCSLTESQGMVPCISARSQPEVETELSDSASSFSVAFMDGKDNSITSSLMDLKEYSEWEYKYIEKILFNSEAILDNVMLGQVNKVIPPCLFDQLEDPKAECDENSEEYFKLERKVLFDRVTECLKLRSEQVFGGSKGWSKWAMVLQRKKWLAEDLYKAISSCRSIGDLLVDELVDRDMSSGLGKWVDFEIEAFEEGAEIEKEMLTSLIDELVTDLLFI
ncbi:hypothetical protein NMG60_11020904 [Bertholletia excelsa]